MSEKPFNPWQAKLAIDFLWLLRFAALAIPAQTYYRQGGGVQAVAFASLLLLGAQLYAHLLKARLPAS
jgi:hypothetical protein